MISSELEYQIIGSFILDSGSRDFIERLNEEDFINDKCRNVFKAMKLLRNKEKEITVHSIATLANMKASDLLNITNAVGTTLTIKSDVEQLKENSNRRLLKQKTNLILKMSDDTTKNMTEIKNEAIKELDSLEEVQSDEVISLGDAMIKTGNLLENRYRNKGDKSFYIGMEKIDNTMGGLHPQELTTIGARPGVGKTMLAMQIALKIATNAKKVMFTSLEMSDTQICERIVSSNTNIDSLRLRTGNIKNDEWSEITNVMGKYSEIDFTIDNTSRTVQQIITKARKFKPDLVVIDYLQLLTSGTREHSREREVATMARDLKIMSLDFNIPVVILSQLNRNAEGKRPTMADLRESGSIEQDSDNIIFLHEPTQFEIDDLIRQGYYDQSFINSLERNQQKLSQIIIEKQRNGPVGTVEVVKVPKIMRFVEIDKFER